MRFQSPRIPRQVGGNWCQPNLFPLADFSYVLSFTIEYSGILDTSNSHCPDYFVGATLRKRNWAAIFYEEFRDPLGILHFGRSMGQSNS